MYNKKNANQRCQICIGCGRCARTYGENEISGTRNKREADSRKKLHVLTDMRLENRKISFAEGEKKRLVAVDIGTTTIAMVLYAKDGSVEDDFYTVNPQTVFGADVISRIQAAENRIYANQQRYMLQTVLREGFSKFKRKIAGEEELFAVIAANTTMIYLLMGWNTAELGTAPFRATHLEKINTRIADIECTILPGLSAFVGSDIVAGIVACGMAEQEVLTLLVDLGTNGEMVLGNCHRMISCATAAGPAFEGGVNRGVWGADMISLLARLRRDGVVDETGLLCDEYFETGIRIGDVCVTQASVRAIQLAKAAVRTGIDILAERYGVELQKIDRVVLAGGFGYYLNPEDAVEIGLLPKLLGDRSFAGGNTALGGAAAVGEQMLSQVNAQKICVDDPILWRNKGIQMEVLNLAEERDFEERYILNMELVKN